MMHHHTVQFHETDLAGLAHHGCYSQWLETAEHAFLEGCEVPVCVYTADGMLQGFPKVHYTIDFKKPARLGEKLAIDVQLQSIRTHSLHYSFTIHKEALVIAQGQFTSVYAMITLATGHTQSLQIPEHWHSQLILA